MYSGLTVTFGVDIVNRVIRNIESGRNVILCFMGNSTYENYMKNNGVDNFKITQGPTYNGSNQCLTDCWPEIKRFYDWCFNERDYIAVSDDWHNKKNAILYSNELKHIIRINYPLFSDDTMAVKYITERLLTEVDYETYVKRKDEFISASFNDEKGNQRYAMRVLSY